ncbi:alpha/beta hydrolase-fold protein [Radiobacillus sp. PE A8.2]|uniref:alpha/beta hydrolase n=1 Tax=Radiobacillus sp. PE A8.2 TaxID=3380349 RepID=UPI00388E5347
MKLFYKIYIASLFILAMLCIPLTTVLAESVQSSSTLKLESMESEALIGDQNPDTNSLNYKIYLPEGYDENRAEGYPVLYLLHGSHGSVDSWDDFWDSLDSMIENEIIEPVIAVVPATNNSYWVDSNRLGNYESAIIGDLIPNIDSDYNTIDDRKGRYLMGYSMGGYGALRYSLAYPDKFNATTLLSPAIQQGEPPSTSRAYTGGAFGDPYNADIWNSKNYPALINSYVNQPYRVPIYTVVGDDDWNHLSEKEDLPADASKYNMEVQAVKLYQALSRKNIFNTDFPKWEAVPANPGELRVVDGGHDLDVWSKGFEEGIKYMFDKGEEDPEWAPKYEVANYATENKGTITTKTLESPVLANDSTSGDTMDYQVYLPNGYSSAANTKYSVLYLLHGSWGDDSSWDDFWPILDSMIDNGDMPPVIAVAPITGNSYWVDSGTYGSVESAIIQDLVPTIERDYPTVQERKGRALVGYSMGGYGAVRYSLVYPELFGGTVLLSPAIEDGEAPITSGAVTRGSFGDPFDSDRWDELNYPNALNGYASKEFQVPMYIIAGDDDWNHLSEKEDLPDDAYKYNMEMQVVSLYERLHRKNIYNKDFEKWEEVPASPAELRIVNGGHGMDVWGYGFEEGMHYLVNNGLLLSNEGDDENPLPDEPTDDAKITIEDNEIIDLTDGSSLLINIDEIKSVVEITASQVEQLKDKKVIIHLKGLGVELRIPAENLTGEGDVQIIIKKDKDNGDALTAVYDFSITQGDKKIDSFGQPVTLIFKVADTKVSNTKDVKIYYYEEENGEWIKIGGTYKDGTVTAETDHFTNFTVFERKDQNDSEQPTDEQEDQNDSEQPTDEQKNNEDDGETGQSTGNENTDNDDGAGDKTDNELPNTASNMFNFLILGVVFLLVGLFSLIFIVRLKRVRL